MPHWNTEQVKTALAGFGDVYAEDYRGDYDTTNICVYPKGRESESESEDCITVTGFRPNKALSLAERDDADDVAYVEVQNFESDSGGGLQSDDMEICILYARIIATMRKMGYSTIRHYDEIF